MVYEILRAEGLALEEAFFRQKDVANLEKIRADLARQQTVDELRFATGIRDEDVLARLADLSIGADRVAAFLIVPLIEVAWADHKIQPQERAAILDAAREKGLDPQSPAFALLDRWLTHLPTAALYDAWRDYARALTSELDERASRALAQEIYTLAEAVARSAGGALGLGKISGKEQAVLDRLRTTLAM